MAVYYQNIYALVQTSESEVTIDTYLWGDGVSVLTDGDTDLYASEQVGTQFGSAEYVGETADGYPIFSFVTGMFSGTTALFTNKYYSPEDILQRVGDSPYILCLEESTQILLASGRLACVRDISAGDVVVTPEGVRHVRFVGRTEKTPFQLAYAGKMPIRIEAGALGELGPQQPIHCTPSHAFLIKGCLVEAQALINGTMIRQLDTWDKPSVTYYSIELEEHALVWANGLLTETYFASVRGKHFSRTSWSNYADYQALYGEGEPMRELAYPRIPFSRQLPAEIRALLAEASPVVNASANAELADYALV